MDRSFWNVSDQWEEHPDPKWRKHWIDEAKKWRDKIPEAEEFLKELVPKRKSIDSLNSIS